MSLTVQLWDEAIPGTRSKSESITLPQSAMTMRELIRSRLQQEVERYNSTLPEVFRGLVQPEQSEQILNGFRMKVNRPLDWQVQYQRACSSFENNGFLVLVDGNQVCELDESIQLRANSEVQFVKLVPLIGG